MSIAEASPFCVPSSENGLGDGDRLEVHLLNTLASYSYLNA
jgi:hypothetical protein